MDRESMTNEENYFFDARGYIIIPGALTPKEVDSLNSTLDAAGPTDNLLTLSAPLREPFRDLLVHPVLVWYLNQICGHGFRLDRAPRLIGEAAGDDPNTPLQGNNEPRDTARAYYFQNQYRVCHGVRVIWALCDVDADDDGVVLVPASHKSNVEAPEDLLTGADDMDLVEQPVLKSGDLLIIGGTTLQGLRPWKGRNPQRLIACEYANRAVLQSNGSGAKIEPRPEWMANLPSEHLAVLSNPGYKDTTDPPPTLNTDGKKTWLEKSPDIIHPSFYKPDPDAGIDHKELYFWDLTGYLIVRNVMDEEWLARANEAIDKFSDRIVVGEELARGSKSLRGTGRPTLSGLLHLPEPYCEPFRKMLIHPAVIGRLNWMMGSGYRCGGATAFCSVKGSTGHSLHGGNEPLTPSRSYVFQNGRSHAEFVRAVWQLHDTTPGGGGFVCVPGSHKAYYRMPEGIRTSDDDMGTIRQPVPKAGDILFFMDTVLTHGAWAWKSDISRRSIFFNYYSRHHSYRGGVIEPEDRWGEDIVEGMTEAQFAVMRGSTRDAKSRNTPRLVVENGQLSVSYNAMGDRYEYPVRKPGDKQK